MFVRMFCTLLVACLLTDIVDANMGAIFAANNEESERMVNETGAGWYTAEGEKAKEKTSDEEATYSDEAPIVKLFEGDIVYTKGIENLLGGELTFDAAVGMQWSANTIPYIISYTHARYIKRAIYRGIKMFDKQLDKCVKWVQYRGRSEIRAAGIKNYIMFFVGGGCYSSIGMVGGEQRISLGRGCLQRGTVMHEMMHALGFWHEQSRLDRDQHIVIHFDNINRRMKYNFNQYKKGDATTLDEPYDIKSIMHYPAKAFSRNGRVVIVHKGGETSFGWQQKLSQIDINQLRKYYTCDKKGGAGGGKEEEVKKPVRGGWSRWSKYSRCSTACTKTTNRACNNPAPANGGATCSGPSSRTIKCRGGYCRPSPSSCTPRRNLKRACKKWKKYCKSRRYSRFMRKNCRTTCKIC